MQSYYAPGKILLAGEYGVLLGLNALALPVKKGQWLEFFDFKTPENNPDTLYFKAIDENGETWLQYNFILDQKPWLELNSDELIPLVQLLRMIPEEHWIQGKSFRLETRLEFARTSGLGTSSTFVSLLSQCFLLNPQRVQELLFQGSGYDVAVSNVQKPLIFWRNAGGAHFRPWKLNPDLTQDWSILFLGNKVNSRSSSASIWEKMNLVLEEPFYQLQFEKVLSMLENAVDNASLEAALEMYQMLISQLLEMPTPYQTFQLKPVKMGLCKWLGAWGGDMILVNKRFKEQYPEWVSNYPSENWNDFVIYE